MRSVEDMVDRLREVDSDEHLYREATQFVRDRGFDGFCYYFYAPHIGIKSIDGRPPEWMQRYVNKGYLDVDPCVYATLSSNEPFSWDVSAKAPGVGPTELNVLHEARDFGLKEGAEIPVHGPGFEVAAFSIYTRESGKIFHECWSKSKLMVRLYAYCFHDSYKRVNDIKDAALEIALTTRERECLLWTARNKTAWEIGEILDISQDTVVSHLKRARKRLGVPSKHQAVVKAVMASAIRP